MGYATATIEEYLSLPNDNTNLKTALPAKVLDELKHSKNLNQTLKKYLINSRQADTNAKIVESLIA